ncbi:MAG: PilN domain-containing protein [Endomicrobia bacterium]|nr:PilN domain-containing protein [Endomicrobiia bacterium]
MININLLPKEIEQQQKLKELFSLVLLVIGSVVLIMLVIYSSRISKLTSINNELFKVEKKLVELQSVVKEVEQLKSTKAMLEARKQLVEKLLSNGLIYPKFMSNLLKVIPDGVWFVNMSTKVELKPNDPQKTVEALKVSLTCSSYDKISIADFISNLENSKKFTNVTLGPINISQQEKYELHNFMVDFKYIVE